MGEEMEDNENVKKIMFIMRNPPHGGIYSYEGLETVLIMAAFEQDLSMVFVGDGVFSLVKNQDTDAIGIKGYIKTYGVLEDYEVEKIYVDRQSMEDRGLTTDDFAIPVEVKEADEIAKLMQEQHATIPY
ncbi:hypothetical protein MNBD_NITROSPINAE04-2284 [hydrothermal vent metagenome]|uniref:Uncharacterized protein n=1 Tax=hydrothermal vent metagenome TaxID=652676 RepID=A0A3B1C745_9ZZZZ